MKLNYYLLQLALCFLPWTIIQAQAPALDAPVDFAQRQIDFTGFPELKAATSLMFGPDDRLYVSEYKGAIKILTLNRQPDTTYVITAMEELFNIQAIQNHNDDGSTDSSNLRETIGITVTGTASNPVFYVTSSDFRIGGGSGGGNGDIGLDTNSGIITRFTWTGSAWDVVDIVRGLPRSEENHATNGLEFVTINGVDYLIVSSGGNTNAGSPSVNFAYTTEYALSAAVLSVNLDMIEAMPIQLDNGRQYIYDLPTLDDPTRANVNGIIDPDDPGYDGVDVNDPFGGNDGLNQAIIDPTGPVQIYSPGYRNTYDLVVTESGALYVTDNGANGGWGGFPENEGNGATVTNNYVPGEPGSSSSSGGEQINNEDHLIKVTTDIQSYVPNSFYAGHPTPVRANPSGAGLFVAPATSGLSGAQWLTQPYDPDGSTPGSTTNPNAALPANWPPVQTANPVEADWRGPGIANPDGPVAELVTIWGTNTNGIDEYTASNFGGAMKGDLIAGTNKGVLRRVQLDNNGDLARFTSNFASGLSGNLLGITCNGDDEIFPGTIWIATLNKKLLVLEPREVTACINESDPSFDPSADYDNDGYSNQDELDNGTDYCNGGSQPDDFDKAAGGTLISDLNDIDDDADGIIDSLDPFQIGNPSVSGSDAFTIPVENELFSDNPNLLGYLGLGFTGLMNNGAANPNWLNFLDRRNDINDPNPNDILGGAIGAMTMQMTSGTALGTTNTQEKGFQYGIIVDQNTPGFTIEVSMLNFYNPLQLYGSSAPVNGEQGIFIGDGTQSNYLKIVLQQSGISIVEEQDDVPQLLHNLNLPIDERPLGNVKFRIAVDPSNGVISLFYEFDSGGFVFLHSFTASGILSQLLSNANSDLAVGLIGTSNEAGKELEATWDYLNVDNFLPLKLNSVLDQSSVEQDDINLTLGYSNGDPSAVYTFTATGLPPGLQLNSSSGLISGQIGIGDAVGSPYNIEIRLEGDSGEKVTTSFSWTVDPFTVNDIWFNQTDDENYTKRHECSFVQAGDRFYLFGGRENPRTLDLYNPTTKTWSSINNSAPQDFNHFQAVEYQGLIWVIGAFKDNAYPNEVPADFVWSYNPAKNKWIQGPEIPSSRKRGSAGLVEHNGLLYVIAGNTDGHDGGYIPWLDVFDPSSGQWTILPDAPRSRDHFHAAVLDGKIYVAGGRLSGGTGGVFEPLIAEVDVYDIATQTWSTLSQDLPTPRAAASVGVLNNEIYVLGGEIKSDLQGNNIDDAVPTNESYNPQSGVWTSRADLLIERHGTQAIVSGNGIHLAAGSNRRGGGIGVMKDMDFYGEDSPVLYSLNLGNLEGPQSLDIAVNSSENLLLTNSGLNLGIIITDMQITGENSQSFSTNFSGFKMIDAGSSSTIQINHIGVSDSDTAVLTVGFDNGDQIQVNLLSVDNNFSGLTLDSVSDQQGIEGSNVSLQLSSSGGSPSETFTYTAQGLPNGLTIDSNTGEISGVLALGSSAMSPYAVTVTADKPSSDLVSQQFNWTVNPSNPVGGGDVLYRVNTGGSTIPSHDDSTVDWSSDTGNFGNAGNSIYLVANSTLKSTYDQGKSSAYDGSIVMTDPSLPAGLPSELFKTERYDRGSDPNMQWSFPVNAGTLVEVRLYFAELWSGITSSGQRVFDVSVEGTVPAEFTDIDAFGRNGALGAFMLSYQVTVTDGSLDLELIRNIQDADINAIEIVDAGPFIPTLVTGVTVDPVAANLDTGDTVLLTATVTPLDATDSGVSWQSSDTSIASVDSNGLVTSLTPGSVDITVTTNDGGFVATSNITVSDVSVTGVLVSPGSLTLGLNEIQTLTATVSPTDATNKLVDWSSSDSGVVSVNPSGQIEGLSAGVATITATSVDGSFTSTSTVTVDNSFSGLTLDSVSDQQGIEGSNVSLQLSSSGGSPSETFTYTAQGLPNGLTIDSNTGEISGVLALGSSAMSPYAVTVTADKPSSDLVSQQFNWTVNPSNPVGGGDVLYRVNTGGSTIPSHDDSTVDWSSDTGNFGNAGNSIYLFALDGFKSTYDQGKSSAYDGSIVMTDPSLPTGLPSELFETQRYDRQAQPNMQWSFPVNAGTLVEVRLYFAELWSGITSSGQRVFDVSVEGTVPAEFTDIDAFGRNGALGAFMLSYQVTVTDGSLDLEFLRGIHNANINAIEIVDAGPFIPTLVTGVTVDPVAANLDTGDTVLLTATVTPLDATDSGVSWQSSDTSIASVDSNGLVTSLTPGSVDITVTTNDGGFVATSNITVSDVSVTGVLVSPGSLTLGLNEIQTLTATVSPTDATNKLVDWSSSDSGVVSVTPSGQIEGLSAGVATITATSVDGSFTSTSTVTVDNSFSGLTLDSVSDQQGIEGSNVSLQLSSSGGSPSETFTYTAQGLPNGLTIDSNTGEISGVLALGSSAMSPYAVTVTADKPSSDLVSQQFNWTVNPSNPVGGGDVLYRVNTGGSTIPSHDDSTVDWSSDTGNFGNAGNSIYLVANSTLKSTYDQGKSSAYDGSIVMTDPSLPAGLPSELFKTERYDRGSDPNMQWSFPVNAGTLVEVRLYFAELWSGITSSGQRVFDVSVEGTVPAEFTDIDAFGRNGALGAFMLSYQVTVTDGSLDLELIRNIQDADINAIEIIEASGVAPLGARILLESDIKMYPVPSDNYVTLEVHSGSKQAIEQANQITIFDLAGRRVLYLEATEIQELIELPNLIRLDTSELTDGIYMIEILGKGRSIFKGKFIVRH